MRPAEAVRVAAITPLWCVCTAGWAIAAGLQLPLSALLRRIR